MRPNIERALVAGVLFVAVFLAGYAIGGALAPAPLPPPGPDCDVTLSDRMAMVIIRLKQAAPCDLAALRERAAAELARGVE